MNTPHVPGTPCGVVLAGGQSTRLGRDKAFVPYRGGDLLGLAVRRLLARLPEVWVIGRDPAPHGLDVPWRLDDVPGHGPAAGVMTALRSTGRSCLVTSCDLPLLDDEHLDALLTAWAMRPEHTLMTTFLQVETGYIEALVSIYEPGAAEVIESALARGERKLSGIFPPAVRHHIPYSREEAMPFFNINFPADLAVLNALERRRAEESA
ncbi:Molybdopterin-guanine dinucleotide biosynthesis protein A [Alkalidesulfovibrio alkalitolerans DSM 16529]|uniref:Probable molybdenum cofactor guanylyltransferase n=1 Tax=Alkalidesulfovibrio alkalitolerans DSM 16529 TaxID=1121439 RepID=S7T270_9BACT|nr:molybdenum cofactor guanylyltransferase [Alkalidesulfovibrio alkalitolerans]EPR30676.1 Molybdopterin-guanine dinucleotide biosynthesis protein A [Alkalidesulfovibrio alkalitolerans DSM 16529]